MDKLTRFAKSRKKTGVFACGVHSLRACGSGGCFCAHSQRRLRPKVLLIADFRRVEVASVSDALEQLTGKRMYMSHRMQPIFTAKFAGLRANRPTQERRRQQ